MKMVHRERRCDTVAPGKLDFYSMHSVAKVQARFRWVNVIQR